MQLFQSRDDWQEWARAIAIMRHGFGEHAFGTDESGVTERREGRVGGIYRPEHDASVPLQAHPTRVFDES